MGELHLEILVDRMRREFKVEANVGRPQVAYRETIRRKVEKVDYTHKKQTGGSGQFAEVKIEPRAAGRGQRRLRVRRTRSPAAASRREYIPSVEPGVQEARVRRARRLPDRGRQGDADRRCVPRRRLLGDGVQNRRLMALQGGRRKANPVLLEPMMAVEVITPEDHMGDVIGDFNGRRGLIRRWTSGLAPRRRGARTAVRDVRLRG